MQPAATDTTVSRMKRAVRRAEAAAFDDKRRTTKGAVEDSGTGYTILKMTQPPVTRLVERGKIGPEALQAAQEIERVFTAVTGGLLIRPQGWEKRDRSHNAVDPGWLVDATARYNRFKDHWSAMAKKGHPLLNIIIRTVQDQQPCWQVARDLNIRTERAELTLIAGLQDYAVRAGWVRGRLAREWLDLAAGLFRLRDAKLCGPALRRNGNE